MTAPTRILLLEDNPSDRLFMDACIHDGGHELQLDFAGRLDEASSRLKGQHYEMVIADLNLPDGEGLDTFFKVKELAEDSAIVVMTGMDDAQLATRAVLAGAQDYLVKGALEPKRVWRSLANALSRHDQMRRMAHVAHDLRKKNNSLREMAYIDALTGLLNRRGLSKTLAQTWTQRHASAGIYALMVNVDDFRRVNELFGYGYGDLALKEIGRRIRATLLSADIGARVGGDEFLVLASVADASAAVKLAEKIRVSVQDASMATDAGSFKVTVSVGAAALGKGPFSVEHILESTQGALKAAKGGGKNRVFYGGDAAPAGEPSGPDSSVVRRPFYDLRNGQLSGYQFMVPDEFGRADAGETVEQVRALLRAAARDGNDLECHLHLSHIQLMRLRPEDLALACGMDPWGLRLSVPGVPMSPLPAGLLDSVRRLQAAGCFIGLHGLNLGAHGLANLILLEPAVVTLDPDLVSGVGHDRERRHGLLRLFRALSGLGASVVADGIASKEDMRALDDIGVCFGCGPLWKEMR
jgi:two-component system, cell cycle response regulator